MISQGSASTSRAATAVLPLAVGPISRMTGGGVWRDSGATASGKAEGGRRKAEGAVFFFRGAARRGFAGFFFAVFALVFFLLVTRHPSLVTVHERSTPSHEKLIQLCDRYLMPGR